MPTGSNDVRDVARDADRPTAFNERFNFRRSLPQGDRDDARMARAGKAPEYGVVDLGLEGFDLRASAAGVARGQRRQCAQGIRESEVGGHRNGEIEVGHTEIFENKRSARRTSASICAFKASTSSK